MSLSHTPPNRIKHPKQLKLEKAISLPEQIHREKMSQRPQRKFKRDGLNQSLGFYDLDFSLCPSSGISMTSGKDFVSVIPVIYIRRRGAVNSKVGIDAMVASW